MSTRSATRRWLNWKPRAEILAETAESELTKPTKAVSVSFVGSPLAKSPKIEAVPEATLAQFDSVELPPIEQSLKGGAVELWRDGNRFFLVADDEDALEAMKRFGARRGEVWTRGELELVARFQDRAVRDEIEALKRQTDGSLSPDSECAKASAERGGTTNA